VDASELTLLNADILAVALFLPSEAVALYFAVTRVTQMLEFVRYSASAATAPRFAALAATQQTGELRRLIAIVTLATTALILAGAIFLSLAAAPLLSLFGSDFASAAWLVPILASGMVVACLSGPGEDVLTMLGQERACAFSYAAALLLSISLLFWLVPALGLAGAALASAAAMACRSLMLALYAYKRLGIILPLGLSWRQVHAA
jgi:O-antigen/teichoic acid export membrane protein